MVAAVVFLSGYALPIVEPDLPNGVKGACESVVWLTWGLFAVDYVVRLILAPDRWAFVRGNMLGLAAVTLPMLRPLRLIRLLVVLERAQHIAVNLRIRAGMYVASGAALLVFVGGLAVTDAERGHPDAMISNAGDGWWWAFVSMTTVGYGDMYPVTVTGRFVAVGLMVAGIAVVGSVTGMVASWILEQVRTTSEEN